MSDHRNIPPLPAPLRVAASTWLGMGLLGAIVVYLSIASTMPDVPAAALGAGPEAVFNNWLLWGLGLTLCGNLVLATVLRVPVRWTHAGAWISHLGVIVLALGSVWYTALSVSGDSATVLIGRGMWSPIRHVYLPRTYAAYLHDPNSAATTQTPVSPAAALNTPLEGAPADVEVRATGFVAHGRVVSKWENVSPNRIPGVEVRVGDGEVGEDVMLSPSLPGHQQHGGRGYAMLYQTGIDEARLTKILAPTAPGQGPRMPHDIALILAGPSVQPTLAVIRPDGTRWHETLQAGKALKVPLAGREVTIELLRTFDHAAEVYELRPAPAGPADRAHAALAGPVLTVELRSGDWRRTTYLPFTMYQDLAPPQLVDMPGGRSLWLSFSRRRLPLAATLQVLSAEYQTWPGSVVPKDYRCRVEIASGGLRKEETLSLNHPVDVGPFQFSQGSWADDPHHPTQIYLIAASRPGLPVIWAGCLLICLGLPVAFYLKPLLLRWRARA